MLAIRGSRSFAPRVWTEGRASHRKVASLSMLPGSATAGVLPATRRRVYRDKWGKKSSVKPGRLRLTPGKPTAIGKVSVPRFGLRDAIAHCTHRVQFTLFSWL
jgi:hypothetical protein